MNPSTITAAIQEDVAFLQNDQSQAILRAVEARLAQQPQVETLVAKLNRVVPGWKTSEFWMTALGHAGLILAAATGALPAKYAAIAAALSQVAYNLSRGLTKNGQGN